MRSLIALGAVLAAIPVAAAASDAKTTEELIANAISAGPTSVTDKATIKDNAGNVLREGSNGFTCYPQSPAIGPMCNDAHWDALMTAFMAKKPAEISSFGVSYMLAGDGDAMGVSNIDPYATEPTPDNDWVKEGPHMMLIVPDPALLEGVSTDPRDPVYVMWKGTPYEHVMVRIED